eukprot:762548-Hanusia_phi.AAC.4
MKKATPCKRSLKEFQPLDKRQRADGDFLKDNVKPAIVDKVLLASSPQKPTNSTTFDPYIAKSEAQPLESTLTDEDSDDEDAGSKKPGAGRRKITIQFVEDKSKRHITFSKRKTGIIKKVVNIDF